jgi:hypothetical protein
MSRERPERSEETRPNLIVLQGFGSLRRFPATAECVRPPRPQPYEFSGSAPARCGGDVRAGRGRAESRG